MKTQLIVYLMVLCAFGSQAQVLPIDSGGSPTDNFWDIQFSFPTVNASELAVETDGIYLYTVKFNGNSYVNQYSKTGIKLDSFLIQGINGVTDLTYNGWLFFGVKNDSCIYRYDFECPCAHGKINTSIAGIRHISYDPTLDGGNGGFWVGSWAPGTLYAVSKTGVTLFNVSSFNLFKPTGSAFDQYSSGGPYLWFFDQGTGPNTPQLIHQFSTNTLTFTGVTHNVSDIPGFDPINGVAGGLCSSPSIIPHKIVLIGSIQQNPNILFCYEHDTIPVYPIDVGVSALLSPVDCSILTAPDSIVVSIHNYGIQPVSGIPLFYQINGGQKVATMVNTVIAPGGNLRIAFPQTVDLSGPGSFEICVNTVLYNDLNISNDTCKNTVTGIYISGFVSYLNTSSTPLNNVQANLLDANGILIQSTITDSLGRYFFCQKDTGNFTIQLTSAVPNGGTNAADALQIMRHFTGMTTLLPLQLIAADVNGDGFVNATDAMMVLQKYVGQIAAFPAGNWVFEQGSISMPTQHPVAKNLKGLCVGDVDGTFFASDCTPSPNQANAGLGVLSYLPTWILGGNIPVNGIGTWQIVSGAGGTICQPNNPSSLFKGAQGTSYVLEWRITTPCANSTDTAVFTFR